MPVSATFGATIFGRFVAADNVFVAEGTSNDTDDDDDCTPPSPLYFSACSLNI